MRLVDSHCHLDFPDFAEERDAVVQRARDAGVEHFLTIATRLASAGSIIAVAEAYPDVSAAIGTHPDHASEETGFSEADLKRIAAHPKVAAIGECGLDYHNNQSSAEDQHAVFRRHIRVSLETGLPLVIHSRDAEDDTARLLREESGGQQVRGVLHCFSSARRLAEEGLEMGLHVSFSGIVTFKNATEIKETVKIVPANRILVETDAPFLAPVPKRGSRNEPAYVAYTAETVAMLKEIPASQLAAQTTENFYRLFPRTKAA